MMPLGIRVIAYWHFFWSSVALFFLLIVGVVAAAATYFGLRSISLDDLYSAIKPYATLGSLRGHGAIHTYELVAEWLLAICGNAFVAFRLLAGSRLGYWLCALELVCASSYLGYVCYTSHERVVLLGLIPPAATMAYLLLPNVRKCYF